MFGKLIFIFVLVFHIDFLAGEHTSPGKLTSIGQREIKLTRDLKEKTSTGGRAKYLTH